ncbi:hypothetical protein ABZ703_33245 [Streptomyces massasporeus]|uniref:hypothetical protein n=1 Tax=Streptomyces massasporeus TaxID=67324 RepID=UPI0033F96964
MSIARSLTPERRRAIGMSLPQTPAKIHAVDFEVAGLTGLAGHKPASGTPSAERIDALVAKAHEAADTAGI